MEMQSDAVRPDTDRTRSLDWRVYADATCAGLSALIPLPLVDLAFEGVFRRRMPASIARASGRSLDDSIRMRLGSGGGCLPALGGCITVPWFLARYVLKRLWRKVIYVLAVTDAAEQVSAYWHRAYLMNHMIRAGHLEGGADRGRALASFGQALAEADTRAVRGMARQVVTSARHAWGMLRRARTGAAEDLTREQESMVRSRWAAVEGSLRRVALRYDELYRDGALLHDLR